MKKILSEKRINFCNPLNKKGIVVIFLTCILASLTGVSILLGKAAYNKACIEYADGILNLSARSCMTKYHPQLKEEYDIFAYYGGDINILKEEINKYIEASCNHGINSSFRFNLKPEIEGIEFNISMHPLTNLLLFKNNILESCDLKRLSIIKNFNKEYKNINEEYNISRELLNSYVIENLPSSEMGIKSSILDDLYIGTDFNISYPIESQIINGYILEKFNSHTNIKFDRFFNHEIEYILTGELNSMDCYKKVRNRLKILRVGLNIMFLQTDPEMQTILTETAAILTPGPEAVATKAALTILWAEREAENDLKLLENGFLVPIKKSAPSWAVDIREIIAPTLGEAPVKPGKTSGINYNGYLNFLLHATNAETKLIRLMDLIQINIITGSQKDFLMKNYYGGMEFYAKVQDKELHFIENY